MNKEIKEYIDKYSQEIALLFTNLREIVLSIDRNSIEEKMWAKLPSYYRKDKFVRLIPFKDHINIEAFGLSKYIDELKDYKFTPKGMLQIKANDSINTNVLEKVFKDTLM